MYTNVQYFLDVQHERISWSWVSTRMASLFWDVGTELDGPLRFRPLCLAVVLIRPLCHPSIQEEGQESTNDTTTEHEVVTKSS